MVTRAALAVSRSLDPAPPATFDASICIEDRATPHRAERLKPLVRATITIVVLAAAVQLLRRALDARRALHLLIAANLGWLLLVVLVTASMYVLAAIITKVSSPARIPLRRAMSMQLAAAFANKFAPGGVAGTVLGVRFFERHGLARPEAIAATALRCTARFVANLAVLVGVLLVVRRFSVPRLPVTPIAAGMVVAAIAGAAAVALASRRLWLRASAVRSIRHALQAWGNALRQPGRCFTMLLASTGVTAAHGLALWGALQGVGISTSVSQVTAIYVLAAAVGSLSPTPGGVGAIEVALAAGLANVGVTLPAAVAAVTTYRLVTYWLPIAPGFVAYRRLRATKHL